jgi:hypothetical protein
MRREGRFPPGPGLCGICQHRRTVESRRGSVFLLCERSREDPRYPRYPPLPVFHCPGFEAGDAPDPESEAGPASGS